MPSASLAMLMLAVGTQKPADPSIWNCSPVAGSFRLLGVNCAATGDATKRSAMASAPYKRRVDLVTIISWISVNEKLARAEGAQDSTSLRERQSEEDPESPQQPFPDCRELPAFL